MRYRPLYLLTLAGLAALLLGQTAQAQTDALARPVWWWVVATAALLSMTGLVLWWQFRQRVLLPLGRLEARLSNLAQGHHQLVETHGLHPALQPVFARYNALVARVIDAEGEQQRREGALRRELHEATRAMLQQHHALTRSERMAATGELAAQLAHDIRNPLAGILAAVENLRRDTEEPDHRERLTLIADEVTRLTRQLNELVDATRQRPETAREVRLAPSIGSLINLVHYQLSEGIEVVAKVPDDLHVTLPEGACARPC